MFEKNINLTDHDELRSCSNCRKGIDHHSQGLKKVKYM